MPSSEQIYGRQPHVVSGALRKISISNAISMLNPEEIGISGNSIQLLVGPPSDNFTVYVRFDNQNSQRFPLLKGRPLFAPFHRVWIDTDELYISNRHIVIEINQVLSSPASGTEFAPICVCTEQGTHGMSGEAILPVPGTPPAIYLDFLSLSDYDTKLLSLEVCNLGPSNIRVCFYGPTFGAQIGVILPPNIPHKYDPHLAFGFILEGGLGSARVSYALVYRQITGAEIDT
jgi:hypothetical protein